MDMSTSGDVGSSGEKGGGDSGLKLLLFMAVIRLWEGLCLGYLVRRRGSGRGKNISRLDSSSEGCYM